jgi:DNA-binding MarR family transcriptional regulator
MTSPTDQPARPWTEDESDATWDLVGARLMDALLQIRRSRPSRLLQRDLYLVDGTELTPVQVDTLECLADRPSWHMRELAGRLGVDPSTATRTLDPLARLGLADREPDPADRRYVIARATARGRAVSRRITTARLALMRDVLAPMPPEDRVRLTELLERYQELIDRHAAG